MPIKGKLFLFEAIPNTPNDMNWLEKIEVLGITPIEGEAFAPLEEPELLNLEQKLEAKLPREYRHFLKTYGASDFEEFAQIPTSGGGIYPGFFYGKNLLKAIGEYKDRLPDLIIPINNDGGDNLICISLRTKDFGFIYFQNHSIGWDASGSDIEKAKETTLSPISKDFPGFIIALEKEED